MNNIDLVKLYDEVILPHLPLEQVYSSLVPADKGDHFAADCPGCHHKGRAYIYKNSGVLKCNRVGGCGASTDPIKFTYGGEQPINAAWVDTVKKLGAMANVPVPDIAWSNDAQIKHAAIMRKRSILEDFQDVTMQALKADGFPSGRDYLLKRGLSLEQSIQRGLGYYHSSSYIKTELEKRGYASKEIVSSGLYNDGWNERVVGPIINLRHEIINFWARDTTGNHDRKKVLYMSNESGASLDVPLGLNKVSGDKVIAVEGIFDCLTLDAHGIKNVIAQGGSNLTNGHAASLLKAKIKSITLLPDNDPAGIEARRTIIEKYANADFEIYVIPAEALRDAKDPDEFVTKYGVAAFQDVLVAKEHGFRHLAKTIAKNCNKSGQWHDDEQMDVLDQASKFEERVTNLRRLQPLNYFWDELVNLAGIDSMVTAQYRESVNEKKARSYKDKLVKESSEKLDPLLKSGDISAIEKEVHKLSVALKEQASNQTRGLALLLENNSREKLIEEFEQEIPCIDTGYKIGVVDLAFPAGALSFIAGPTGHGKTSALINFSLGVIEKNPSASVYFLTYEESAHHILAKFLNAYANVELNDGNNRGALFNYFHALNDTSLDPFKYFSKNKGAFLNKESAFFNNIVDTGRLKVLRPDMSTEELVSAIKFIKQNDPNAGLIVIDYIQLLDSDDHAEEQRHEELMATCKALRNGAIETGLGVVLGAQFNRDVKTEALLSQYSIADCHGIAKEAELIIGLWNRNHNDIDPSSEVYLKVLKGRNIGVGHNSLMPFDGNIGKIENKKNDNSGAAPEDFPQQATMVSASPAPEQNPLVLMRAADIRNKSQPRR